MAFNKFLIKPHKDMDDFALSWQAGLAGSQSIAKLKNHDIEAVNVIATCEKLNSTLQNTTYLINESQGHEDSETQCAVKISEIPFRSITNIWFGTLRIYQQQVNNLLRLSKDLFVRSKKTNFNQLEAVKRKSSLTSNNAIKKRRLTITNTNEKTFITSNYSELLDELEILTQESKLNTIVDKFPSVIPNTCTVTQLQIREITIREISETTFTTNDIFEDDSGFGEATREDIEYFLNFTDDNLHNNIRANERKSLLEKRKSVAEQRSPIKKCRYSVDYLPEEPIFKENHKCSISSFKEFETVVEDLRPLIKENKNYENKYNMTPTETIKQEDVENCYYVKRENSNKAINKKKKKSKLIIDVCTKIDTNEILDEMNKNKPIIKSSRKQLIRFCKMKKFATALDLLNTFNRRSLKLSQNLKKKIYYSQEQFEKDYLYILRDIFELNYNEKLASEIYSNWQHSPKIRKQHKHRNLEKEFTKEMMYHQDQETDLNNSNDYLNTVSSLCNNNLDNKHRDDVFTNKNYDENNNAEHFSNQHEWRPYGVMIKLLSLWRCHQTIEIEAAVLFKLAENRFDKALGFYSLLMLSKNRFVVFTTYPEAIVIRKIQMGEATKTAANYLN